MKKILLVFAMIVCMTTCFVGGAFAQGAQYGNEKQIPWENYAVSAADAVNQAKGVYLCCMTTENGEKTYRFVNAGGDNGTCAVLSSRGLRLNVEASGNQYKFKSSIVNPSSTAAGEYLGEGNGTGSNKVYHDQDRAWTVEDGQIYYTTSGIFGITTYHYITPGDNGALSLSNSAPANTTWLIIPRESFRTVLLSVKNQTNINVSGLFLNTRFLRNMVATDSWDWYAWDGSSIGGKLSEDAYNTDDNKYQVPANDLGRDRGLTHGGIESMGAFRGISPYIGNGYGYPYGTNSYVTTYGAFGTAEMRAPIIMRQTVTGLKPGTYVITAQAFVSNDNSAAPITDGSNIAYLFAAGTNGVSEGALIPQLSDGEQTSFNGYITKHQDEFNNDEDRALYFRRNVAAGEFLATNNGAILTSAATYSPDETNHLVTIAVNVTGTGENDGTLTIGVAKNTAQGRVYVDNIKIYYSGDNEFGINAYSTNNTELSPTNLTGIDMSKYEFARVFNLSRDFGATTDDKVITPVWEALVMPVNLTKTQVLNTFGDDVKLCHLKGLDNGGRRIQFNTVDLRSGNGNETAIYAGECYAVKVTEAPTIKRNDPRHEFIVFSVDENINNAKISYPSPVYQFTGVTRMDKLNDLIKSQKNIDEDDVPDTQMSYFEGTVTKTYKTAYGNLLFTGYFYKPASVAKGNYVLNAGTVYHLTGEWNGLVGTMWTLQEVDDSGAAVQGSKLSIDFDGDHLTGIKEISADGAADAAVEGIYNLNGQKVSDDSSMDNLPKGIYIVNGRKMVVR